MEQDEKFENQLNLALDLSEEERERSKDLDAGYDKETDQWEIIFRYAGTLDTIRWSDTTRIEPLSMGYAIAYIKEDELEAFGANEQVKIAFRQDASSSTVPAPISRSDTF